MSEFIEDSGALEVMTQEQLEAMVGLHERFLQGRLGGRRAALRNVNISGLSLAGKNMRQASFVSCLMQEMDLSSTDFQEASLYACDLSYSNLNNTTFIRADLRGARVENASLQGANLEKADLRIGGVASTSGHDAGRTVNFRGADLTGAKLVGSLAGKANFSDAVLVNANISNADLTGAHMEGANLAGAEIIGTKFSGANMKFAILTGIDMSQLENADIDISGAVTDGNAGRSVSDLEEPLAQLVENHRSWVESAGRIGKQLDLSNVDLRLLKTLKKEKMTAIRAVGANFLAMNLFKIELQSAVLDGSDFRNCDMEEADIRGSSFNEANLCYAKMRGINASPLLFGDNSAGKKFSPCSFVGARMRYCDFKDSKFKNTVFRGADLSYADFSNADLREADFTEADLTGTIFENAQTEGAIGIQHSGRIFKIPGNTA